MIRTNNYGFVAMGGGLSITNGVTREVRAMILEREAKDRDRRKGLPQVSYHPARCQG